MKNPQQKWKKMFTFLPGNKWFLGYETKTMKKHTSTYHNSNTRVNNPVQPLQMIDTKQFHNTLKYKQIYEWMAWIEWINETLIKINHNWATEQFWHSTNRSLLSLSPTLWNWKFKQYRSYYCPSKSWYHSFNWFYYWLIGNCAYAKNATCKFINIFIFGGWLMCACVCVCVQQQKPMFHIWLFVCCCSAETQIKYRSSFNNVDAFVSNNHCVLRYIKSVCKSMNCNYINCSFPLHFFRDWWKFSKWRTFTQLCVCAYACVWMCIAALCGTIFCVSSFSIHWRWIL